MFEKKYEYERYNKYFKGYLYNQEIKALLDLIQDSNLQISRAIVYEDNDVGLGNVGGLYGLDTILSNLEHVINNMESLSLYSESLGVQFIINDKTKIITLVSKDSSMEIDDLISIKKKRM